MMTSTILRKKLLDIPSTSLNDLEHSLKDAVIEKALDILLSSKRLLFYGVGA